MPQWGKNDVASNSVLWGVTGFNGAPNTTNQTAFYGNTSRGAWVTDLIVGQFGVDTTEVGVGKGPIVHITVTNNGTGYTSNTANGTFTVTNGGASTGTAGAANAFGVANSTGKIASVTIGNFGNNYVTSPTFTLSAPTANSFNANSAVTAGAGGGANSVIAVSSARAFVAGDAITYYTSGGNTAISGLANNTLYYVQFANTTHIALTTTPGGSRITLTKGLTETGHFLQGVTATAVATVAGAANKGVSHAGWVVRTVGTGGRAGRVQYETLVAMGSITGDGSDDPVLPDA